MNMPIGSTGFFGVPGRVLRDSHSVHYVVNGKPICGTRIHPDAEFQFCGRGLHYNMLECEKCRQIMKTRTLKWFDSLSQRDLENQAVLNEIRDVFKERDQLLAELNRSGPKESPKAAIARRRETGGHWGFTLIELMVIISIIAILGAVILPMMNRGTSKFGTMAGIVSDFSLVRNKHGDYWEGTVTMVGTVDVRVGKTTQAEPNTRTFRVPAVETNLANQVDLTMGHVVKLRYRRDGFSYWIIGVQDTWSVEDTSLPKR